MAVDKLVDSAQLDADLGDIADAIRAKGGTSAQLAFPAGFVSAVEAIETGGGGDETVTFTDWENTGVTSSSGSCSTNTVRCLLPHSLRRYKSMTVPAEYDFAIFACALSHQSNFITLASTYVGGWTGSDWQKTLTWHNGGNTVDFTQLVNWDSYVLTIVLRNHGSDSAISTSAGANVTFTYDPSVGAVAL